jgi:peptide chain release factor 1
MNQSILAKLEQLSMRLEEINALLSDQSVAYDQNKFRDLSIEHSQLSPVNDKYKEYLSTIDNINAEIKLLEEEDDDIK